jgi:hypothetical protein
MEKGTDFFSSAMKDLSSRTLKRSVLTSTPSLDLQTANLPYLALTYRYQIVADWCRGIGVNPRTIKPVTDFQQARGVSDHNLILMSGWNTDLRRGDLFEFLRQRAVRIYRVETDVPVVRDGRIVGWILSGSEDITTASQD